MKRRAGRSDADGFLELFAAAAVVPTDCGEPVMKAMLMGGAAAVLLLALPDAAQKNTKTIDPIELTKQVERPPLAVSDEQKTAIRDGLVAEHTQQKTPKDFQPQVGAALPKTMKVDVMPPDLVRKQPSLKQYGYAKTASDILVLDPMKKTIIAVVPRKFPADAKASAKSPADWADSKGREMTGQPPKGANADQFPEPAGDSGDVTNGNEKNALETMPGKANETTPGKATEAMPGKATETTPGKQ
jgi:hypothetical protein